MSYLCLYINVSVYIYIYIYIYIEREREIERDIYIYIYIYVFTSWCSGTSRHAVSSSPTLLGRGGDGVNDGGGVARE